MAVKYTQEQSDEAFMGRVIHGPGQCHTWSGARGMNGLYGLTRICGKRMAAHRYAWERVNGPIPEGLHIDHLCRHPLCVNPNHLDVVTTGENTRRGGSADANYLRALERTHCKHGHGFTPENTYLWRCTRHCRICRATQDRKRRAAWA